MTISMAGPQSPASNAQGNPLADYFANKPAEQLIEELKIRRTNQWNMLQARGVPRLWKLAFSQAFGMDPDTGRNATQSLQFCGPQANFIRFRINLARAHLKQRNNLAMGQRPSFRAVALNNDARSLGQVQIVGKAIAYLFREAGGEQAYYEALTYDSYLGEGFVWQRWDDDAGDTQTVVEQQPANDQFTGQPLIGPNGQPETKPVEVEKRTGQPSYVAVLPWNVASDINVRKTQWRDIGEKASKYELMARYPEHAQALKGLTLTRENEPGLIEMMAWDFASVTDDTVIVHHFYHRASRAVPGGRYVGYVGGIPLWDVPCPVQDGLPISSICSARYWDTPVGYPEGCDILAPQEMIDELLSQSATNVLKHGNQNIWGEDGVEFDQVKYAQGGAYFTLKTGQKPPAVVQWAQLPEATKYLLEYLPERMGEVSGINPTMLGTPDANITSGVFASIMQQVAEKFVSATQAAYDFALNEGANISLELVRANADQKFLIEVSGNSQQPYMQYFELQDIAGVKRVYVERQSPVMNSIGGRFEVLERTRDLPRDERHAAIVMLKTGDDSAWTETDLSCDILIERENEMLSKGMPVKVERTDDPKLHCPKHRASFDRLRAQDPPQDPQAFAQWQAAMKAHLDHINGHGIEWMQMLPVWAEMLGLPAPPMFDPTTGQFHVIPTAPAGPGGAPAGPGGGPQQPPTQGVAKPAPQLPAQPKTPSTQSGNGAGQQQSQPDSGGSA